MKKAYDATVVNIKAIFVTEPALQNANDLSAAAVARYDTRHAEQRAELLTKARSSRIGLSEKREKAEEAKLLKLQQKQDQSLGGLIDAKSSAQEEKLVKKYGLKVDENSEATDDPAPLSRPDESVSPSSPPHTSRTTTRTWLPQFAAAAQG